MNGKITINLRSKTKGKEADFVESFLKTNNLFEEEHLNYIVLQETIVEGNVPDILVISWEKKKDVSWKPERNILSKNDIKILHFITTTKSRGGSQRSIINKLGYDDKIVVKTIQKLKEAKLIVKKKTKVFINEFECNFFIKDIVAIEAKLNNWKKAFQQAHLNQNFSSKSYVLIPERKHQKLDSYASHSFTGLITYDGEKAKIKKKAKRHELPGSYFSWIINEHIGKMVYGE